MNLPSTVADGRLFLQKRGIPVGVLSLHFLIAIGVLFVASWGFVSLSEDVVENEEIVRIDAALAHFLHQRTTTSGIERMLMATHLGSALVVGSITLLLTILFVWRKKWERVFECVSIVGGGIVLNLLLKMAFHRQRPVFEDPIVSPESFSYPSGHTMAATLLFGFLALLAIQGGGSVWKKGAEVAAAFGVIALVAMTRIYLGAHFLSDVLGGFAAGILWIALCVSGLAVYRMAKERQANAPLDDSNEAESP